MAINLVSNKTIASTTTQNTLRRKAAVVAAVAVAMRVMMKSKCQTRK